MSVFDKSFERDIGMTSILFGVFYILVFSCSLSFNFNPYAFTGFLLPTFVVFLYAIWRKEPRWYVLKRQNKD